MSDRTRDARAYILAATICQTADLPTVRQEVAGLRLKGQQKLHWRDESDKRRRQIAEFIALLPLEHVVVIRNAHPDDRPERRRRHAMERLLHELDQADVKDVTFESRDSHSNNRDREMLNAYRSRRVVSLGLRISHVGGRDDAMLWVADVLCGVTVKQRTGDVTYLEAIQARSFVRIIEI
jgi:hypothetical protein